MMKPIGAVMSLFAILIGGFIVFVSFYLPLQDPLQKADAIIAVSGGDTNGRTMHAIELYKEGWAPQLIFSGAAKDPESASNAKVMMSMAVAQGVPPAAIAIDEQSRDTKENAKETRALIGDKKTVILVTSDYHQRRAHKEFQKVLGSEVKIINAPAKDKHWGRKSWFLTPYGWWISLTETVRAVL